MVNLNLDVETLLLIRSLIELAQFPQFTVSKLLNPSLKEKQKETETEADRKSRSVTTSKLGKTFVH